MNLHKKIAFSLLTAALMASSSFALDTSKAYGAASVALESVSAAGMDSGFAIILGGGLPVIEAGKVGPGTIAVEAELTYSLVAPSYTSGSYKSEWSTMSVGAYGAYIFNIDKQFFVKPRAGLVYRSYSWSNNSGSSYYGDYSTSEIGIAFGVQGGYKLNEQLDIIVGYNLLDGTDLTHLSAGVQYHF